ncbi:hypothetical protein Adt_16848 [Abeliophyllum distichum]|uniref:Uncharacterized protein n=1 Tax=Abeliophyllum distichum TaxID=126358 RepID=A0ABD1TFD5_9LAMI
MLKLKVKPLYPKFQIQLAKAQSANCQTVNSGGRQSVLTVKLPFTPRTPVASHAKKTQNKKSASVALCVRLCDARDEEESLSFALLLPPAECLPIAKFTPGAANCRSGFTASDQGSGFPSPTGEWRLPFNQSASKFILGLFFTQIYFEI